MSEIIVKLSKKYEAFGEVFDSVTLREPTYKDVFQSDLGRPFEFHPTGNGGVIVETKYATIAAYVDRLAVKPTSESLGQISAIDGMRLQEVIAGFFRERPESTASPVNSSSASGSTSEPSPE